MSPSTSKRIFDFTLATFLSLLLLPLMMLVFLIIRISSRGPALYWSQRVGRNNEIFLMPKFRTMRTDTPQLATHLIESPDKWLVPCGSFLRKTSLDELPQLWSILKGDMSFVGPRPLMPISFEQYAPEIQAVVYNSKPGITGIGSVIFRDEEKLVTESGMDPWEFYKWHIFPLKGALEQWYQKKKSFYTDLMLLFLTAWAILFPHSKLPYTIFPQLPKI